MKREYVDSLNDMLENAEKALSFVKGMEFDDFQIDDKAVYAVIHAFEIIGEAAVKFLRMCAKRILKSHGGRSLEYATN